MLRVACLASFYTRVSGISLKIPVMSDFQIPTNVRITHSEGGSEDFKITCMKAPRTLMVFLKGSRVLVSIVTGKESEICGGVLRRSREDTKVNCCCWEQKVLKSKMAGGGNHSSKRDDISQDSGLEKESRRPGSKYNSSRI